MRLKYYLRGLGIGIVVTAVIMGVSAGRQRPAMTEEQIIARAKELGMVEQEGILAEIAGESAVTDNQKEAPKAETSKAETPKQEEVKAETTQTAEPKAEALKEETAKTEAPKEEAAKTEAPKEEAAKTEAPKEEAAKTEAPKEEAAKTEAPKEEAAKTETPEPEETSKPETVQKTSSVVVSIYPGEGSYTVSRKLAALGLVESADIYDKFLCQNGYDKKLCTGNYTITEGATADEIARILTKRQ